MPRSRILIVKNDKTVAKTIKQCLEGLNYTVAGTASSASAAIKMTGKTHPDLVLMQLRLNGSVDGIETAAHIRSHFDLPVVYLTASTDDDIWQQAQPSEPFGYVLEPFTPRELQLAIEGTLQQQSTDKKLRESEQRFHQVVSSISDHIYMTRINADGSQQNLYLSPQIESLTGYPRQNFMDDWHFWASVVIHPEDRAAAEVQAGQLATGRNSRIEYRLIRRDDEIIWVRDSAVVHQEGDAKIVYGLITNISASKQVETALQDSLERLTIAHHQTLIYARELTEEITERKQTEEALREREERFRVVADTAPVLIWMSGSDTLRTFFNKPWLDFTGRTMGQELGNGWLEGVHQDDYKRCLDIYLSSFQARREFQIEYRLRRADGEYRWVVDNAIPRFEGNNFVGYIGSCLDITQRKQAEEALRLRDRAIAAVPNGISIADATQPDMPLIYCNPGFEEITGYSEAEVLGRNCRFLQGPDTDPAALDQIRKALRQGSECQVELKNYRKDGVPFWNELTISPIRDEAGRLTHFVGIQNDITRRKQSEEQLRASEERFRRVISSISDHIYVTKVTADGTMHNLYLSPHAEALTGYPLKEFMNDWSFWPSTVIHPDDRAVAAAQANQLIQGHNSEAEYRIIRADGQIMWVRDSGRAEREDDATIIYGVVGNITKRRYLEEQLRQSQKMEAVGRLAGGIAHDFNNLLTVIVGDCELILNSGIQDEILLEDITSIKAAGERAAALTQQLLAFSRKQILEPKVLNLNRIVTGVDNLLRRLLGDHIELAVSLDSQLKPVKVDLHQLEQVIVNLAVNARDAMPKGGRLIIETSNETMAKPVNDQQLIEPGDYVKLIVHDTGAGMDTETQSHIFEPFFTTKKQGKGTGLGLATVYGIVQQSGGHIVVTSAPDKGTTFTIYLPQAEIVAEALPPEVLPATKPVGGSETILLVEDESRVRTIIRKFLQKAGYTVLEAHNSEEALSFCQKYEGSIHLLVTDIMMPGLSGPELAERLIVVRPAIKVLYMSGYADEIMTQQALSPGSIILQKPFTPDTLAHKAWELLHSPAGENVRSTR